MEPFKDAGNLLNLREFSSQGAGARPDITMQLSLKNYRKILPAALVKKAGRITIRECDEIEKGRFQAYADEKDKSYDVGLTFDSQGNITAQSCDCGEDGGFCRHMASLLILVSEGSKVAVPRAGRKKKADPIALLVEHTDPAELRDWVKELLKKNADLALSFEQRFAQRQEIYTPKSIRDLTLQTVTSVAKKRVKLEVGEVKKIIALWKEVHAPVLKDYFLHMADSEHFLNLEALLVTCLEVIHRARTTSTRLGKYPAEILNQVKAALHDIRVESSWDTATGYFIARLKEVEYPLMRRYYQFLTELPDASTPQRGKRLIWKLLAWYQEIASGEIVLEEFTIPLFKATVDSGLFDEYAALFKPHRFSNAYNTQLINLLIEKGDLERAAIYCEEQIAGNFKEHYNIPYWHLLKKIHTLRKDNASLTRVMMLLFPVDLNFDDYLFISTHLDKTQRGKWRTQALRYASNYGAHHAEASRFIFRLLEAEGEYKKMIASIDYHTQYSLIAEHAEAMLKGDGAGFLETLLAKPDYNYFHQGEAEKLEKQLAFERLEACVRKQFTKAQLKAAIGRSTVANQNAVAFPFIHYLKQKLG